MKFIIPAFFALTSFTAFGSTVGVSPCTAQSLSTYGSDYAVSLPGSPSCSVGILDFSNFTYVGLQNAPAESDILVGPGNSGLDFSQEGGAPFQANGDVVQFAIYYNIAIDPAPVIPSADNHLDPPVGDVTVSEFFCNDSVLYVGATNCFPTSDKLYTLTVTTANPNNSITFNPPATSFQTVEILFTLDGTQSLAAFDGLDTTDNVTTPEPASALLVGLSFLAGCGVYLKRKS